MQSLSTGKSSQSQQIESLNLEIENINIVLLESEEARNLLKIDIGELNDRIIVMEEENYETKNIQLDLLEQLQEMEGKNELLQQ